MELCHTVVAMRHSYIVTNYVASKWSYIATICNKISILLPSNQMTFCTKRNFMALIAVVPPRIIKVNLSSLLMTIIEKFLGPFYMR